MMGKTKVDVSTSIPEFYKGKSIFLTGFTGSLGKILVEKLLYSCPDVGTIYVLVRPKKGLTPQQRVEQILTSRAFNRLKEKYPGRLESKVVGVAGDMLEEGLGLSEEDARLLSREVSIILHGAASVRFDDPLDVAVKINTLGAKRIVDLALTMPQIVCLTYISTAYTNCDHLHIKEELYPPKADWRNTVQIYERIDRGTIEPLLAKYMDKMPNTYSFSKSLAEHVINDYRDRLPVLIVRPSIVISSAKEPEIGWLDNIYGPIASVFGTLLGLTRCGYFDKDNSKLNAIPSDIAVNSILAATWKFIVTRENEEVKKNVAVYHACCPESLVRLTVESRKLYDEKHLAEAVNKDGIRHDFVVYCGTELSFKINSLLRHFLPSLLIDLALIMKGIEPVVVKIRRKIYITSLYFKYFTFNTFKFDTNKMQELLDHMQPLDKEHFGWDSEMFDHFKNGLIRYNNHKHTILKPLFDDLETNAKRLRMLYIVDMGTVYLTYCLLGFFLYYFNIPSLLLSTAVRLVTFP